MLRRGLVVLVIGACAPVGEAIEEEPPPSVPIAPSPARAALLFEREAPCVQSYPSYLGIERTPWIWDSDGAHDEGQTCRLGCSVGPTRSTWSFDGLTVSLLAHGDWVVNSDELLGVWQREIDPGEWIPRRVRWTTWCGPLRPVVFAAYDEHRLTLVTLDRQTGEELARVDERLDADGSPQVGIDVQMYCTVDGAQLHAKSERRAWWSSYSTDSLVRLEHRELPPALAWSGAPADDHDGWLVLPHLPRSENRGRFGGLDRERLDTSDRRYDRVGFELFALAPNGDPLWHRAAVTERPGCTDWSDSLVGCSRCPTPSQHLARFEDWIVLRTYDIRSTLDVFDRDGTHLVHLAE